MAFKNNARHYLEIAQRLLTHSSALSIYIEADEKTRKNIDYVLDLAKTVSTLMEQPEAAGILEASHLLLKASYHAYNAAKSAKYDDRESFNKHSAYLAKFVVDLYKSVKETSKKAKLKQTQ